MIYDRNADASLKRHFVCKKNGDFEKWCAYFILGHGTKRSASSRRLLQTASSRKMEGTFHPRNYDFGYSLFAAPALLRLAEKIIFNIQNATGTLLAHVVRTGSSIRHDETYAYLQHKLMVILCCTFPLVPASANDFHFHIGQDTGCPSWPAHSALFTGSELDFTSKKWLNTANRTVATPSVQRWMPDTFAHEII